MINLLTKSNLTKSVNAIIKSNNPAHVQEVLVNIIYQTFKGNYNYIITLRDENVPAAIRGYLGKHTPVVYNKDSEKYSFSMKKAEKLRNALGWEDTSPSFDTLGETLPFWKPEKEMKARPVDALAQVKALIKKLEKGIEEDNLAEGTNESAALVLGKLKELQF